jgi:adenine-specific DNA-methyltransferase
LGAKILDYPKPPSLMVSLIHMATRDNDIILDSFAGSGTTAQAVLEANTEDGYNRKFILIQMKHETKQHEAENYNICQQVTLERTRRIVYGYSYTSQKGKKTEVEGLGGTFAYARISEHPLFGEYHDLGDHLPSWENLAAYIFYTETSRQFDRNAADPATGKIGEQAGTGYYLLYTPDDEAGKGLGIQFLKGVAAHDPNKKLVVYSEKFVMHRDTLHKWEEENRKKVRSMLVPFNLR